MGEFSTETRLFTWMVHAHDNDNAFLSEGGALAGVVGDFPVTAHQTRDDTDFPRPVRKSEARLRLASPPFARRNDAPHERGAGGESDPTLFAAGTARGRVKVDRGPDTFTPSLWVALTTEIPAGRLLSRLSMDNEGDGSVASLPRPVRACGGQLSRKISGCG